MPLRWHYCRSEQGALPSGYDVTGDHTQALEGFKRALATHQTNGE